MNRARLWKAMDRQKASYRRAMRPVFTRAFDQQIQPLYDKIAQASDIRDIVVPPLNNEAIERAYKKLYMTTALDFAKGKRARLRKSYTKSEEEIFEDLIMENIQAYLRNHAGETVVAAGDTSVVLIERLLKKITPEIASRGIGGGEATTLLRDMIGSEWHQMKYYRTERIVRTEVNRASNWGSLEGVKSLGVRMNKVWLSAFVGESRGEHMAADGQAVDLEESFVVWGETLQYPGDPAGSAANTINCLCSLYEEPKQVEEPPPPGQQELPFAGVTEQPPVQIAPPQMAPPAPEPVRWAPAASIKEAEAWAMKNLDVKYVDYRGLALETANDMNKAVFETKKMLPGIQTHGLGSAQKANKALRTMLETEYKLSQKYQILVQTQGERVADLYCELFVSKHVSKVGGNTVAWSTAQSEIRIAEPMGQYRAVDVSRFKGVFVNEKWGKNYELMSKTIKQNEASGWWVKGDGTFKDIIYHEIGHEIDNTIGFHSTSEFNAIFAREHGKGIKSVIDRLSEYGATAGGKATHKPMEMVAEAWAEFMSSRNPRELATEIGETILRGWYNKKVRDTGTPYSTWRSQISKIIGR